MGKTRDLFKKIRDTKGTFHAKMGSVRSIPFLSFIEPNFAWNVPLVSLITWRDLYSFPFCCFPLFLCIDCWRRLSSSELLFVTAMAFRNIFLRSLEMKVKMSLIHKLQNGCSVSKHESNINPIVHLHQSSWWQSALSMSSDIWEDSFFFES